MNYRKVLEDGISEYEQHIKFRKLLIAKAEDSVLSYEKKIADLRAALPRADKERKALEWLIKKYEQSLRGARGVIEEDEKEVLTAEQGKQILEEALQATDKDHS